MNNQNDIKFDQNMMHHVINYLYDHFIISDEGENNLQTEGLGRLAVSNSDRQETLEKFAQTGDLKTAIKNHAKTDNESNFILNLFKGLISDKIGTKVNLFQFNNPHIMELNRIIRLNLPDDETKKQTHEVLNNLKNVDGKNYHYMHKLFYICNAIHQSNDTSNEEQKNSMTKANVVITMKKSLTAIGVNQDNLATADLSTLLANMTSEPILFNILLDNFTDRPEERPEFAPKPVEPQVITPNKVEPEQRPSSAKNHKPTTEVADNIAVTIDKIVEEIVNISNNLLNKIKPIFANLMQALVRSTLGKPTTRKKEASAPPQTVASKTLRTDKAPIKTPANGNKQQKKPPTPLPKTPAYKAKIKLNQEKKQVENNQQAVQKKMVERLKNNDNTKPTTRGKI